MVSTSPPPSNHIAVFVKGGKTNLIYLPYDAPGSELYEKYMACIGINECDCNLHTHHRNYLTYGSKVIRYDTVLTLEEIGIQNMSTVQSCFT